MDNSPKGAFFALEMNTSNVFQFTQVRTFLIVLFWTFAAAAGAQRDSSMLLRPEQLNENDILAFYKIKDKEVIQSVSRLKEKPGDLPFSTWVITAEDILRYGFVTLTDVLKAAPGIRVSQPGNATEGETFMIRGLSGNQYVKILINDIPIRPAVTLGMPIGAQLPIRQAERIELLYGTAGGMMYGDEACAGVVNIIIKETERPIYTQADLGFGTQGYNSLDLMFGGRLFKDKNVMRFSLYGSSTVRNKTDIFWDTSAFNPTNYYLAGMTRNDFNFFEHYEQSVDDDNMFIKRPQEHVSRMFGMMATWRGAQFSYHRMSRSDPSCLGYSPLAISYATSGKQIKDRIDVYSLRLWKKAANYQLISNTSLELYQLESTSTANYIFDKVSALNYLSNGGAALVGNDRAFVLGYSEDFFSSGSRYLFARGVDVRWEGIARLQLWKNLWTDNGVRIDIGDGYAQIGHLDEPQTVGEFRNYGFAFPFSINSRIGIGVMHVYSNFEWVGKKIRITAGSGAATSFKLSPRLAILYHIDSVSSVFANGSMSANQFQHYKQGNTYGFTKDSVFWYINPYQPRFENSDNLGKIETFRSAELGYRRNKSEIVFFAQQSYNLSRDGYYRPGTGYDFLAGYYSNPGLSHQIWGIQTRIVNENTAEINRKGKLERNVTWRNELFVQYSRGKEWFGLGLNPTNEIRNFPKFITQFRSSGRTGRLQFTVAANRQSSVQPKSKPFAPVWTQLGRTAKYDRYSKFATWDLLFRFYLNKNFVLYFNTVNIFNKKTYGIDASGSIDDLLAPLQQRRQMRFGINYNMN